MLGRLYIPHIGGVERHVERLSGELIRRGHEVGVVTEQYDPGLKLREVIDGVKVIRLPDSALKSKPALWREVTKFRPKVMRADVVHIHDVWWWFIPFLGQKPYYITFHGYEGSRPPRWQAVGQRKMAEKLAKGSICVGDFMRKWYRARPNMAIYGAADRHKPASKWARSNQKAIFWGRLAEDTGVATYVDAAAIMPGMTLDVYGGGEKAKAMAEKAKEMPQKVHYHGWVEKIGPHLHGYRYAFVSRYLSIIEAMQARLLVCAVYNNEIKQDYLRMHPMANNMIVAGTAKELAAQLTQLGPEREKEMIRAAHGWAKQQTWDKVADSYEQLWGRR